MKLSTEARTAIVLGLAGTVILGLALLSYDNMRALASDSRSVSHTHEVLQNIDSTLSAIVDAETGGRGYQITGDESYLETYRSARSRVKEGLDNLRRLIVDSTPQQQRLASLESHTAARLDLLQEGTDLRRQEGFESARQFVQTGKGAAEMEQIRRTAAEMKQQEHDLLKQREKALNLITRRTLEMITVVVLFVFFLLWAVYFMVQRDLHERRRVRQSLQDSEARLRGLLEVAPVGVLGVNAEGRILLANAQAEKDFGYGHGELLGVSIESLMPEKYRAQHTGNRVAYTANPHKRTMGPGLNLCGRRKDGSEFPVEVGLSANETNAGRMTIAVIQDITARQRAEKELRESQERYELAVQGSNDGLWDRNIETNEIYFSPRFKRFLGYEDHDLPNLYEAWASRVHPDDYDHVMAAVKDHLEGATPVYEAEYRLRHKDGSYRWILARGVCLRHASGKPFRIAGSLTDITERKTAEEETRRANSFLDSVVENIPHMVFIKDARDLRYVRLNKAGEELIGCRRDELLGKTDHDVFSKEEADFFVANDREVLKNGVVLDIGEESLHTKHHGVRILHTKKMPICDAAGRPAYLLGVSEDITERKQIEEELRRYQEELEQKVQERTAELSRTNEALLEQVEENRRNLEILRKSRQRLSLHVMQTPLAVIEWDRDYKIMEWNPAAERIFGYTREEALGRHANFIVPEPAREHTEQVRRDLVALRGGLRSTNENITKEGKTILCEWYNTPLVDKNGRVVGIASLANDITEHRKLEEQFRQSQKMEAVGQLAGGIAHDFNNILNVILGYSDVVLDDMSSGDPQRQRVENIKSAGERAALLTRQLLAFSRKQVLEPRVVNLNNILQDMDHLLQRLIGEDIELQKHTDPSLGLVKVDPGQMEQVIMNLAINARDAMLRGGKLTLEAGNVTLHEEYTRSHAGIMPGEYVMLAVSDTGIGMDPATQERIFEPFFTTKEPGKGTGLGLSTVYGIVKQSGGNVAVYSEPGRGTTFKIYLPRVDEMPLAAPPAESLPAETRGVETILVVEDDEELRELAHEYLTGKGYTVLAASSGTQALQLVERHPGPIALVITDVVMPGISGLELAKKLAELRPQIKALFVSGYTQNAIVHHGVLDPGIEFLQKPYKPSDLARKIRSILG